MASRRRSACRRRHCDVHVTPPEVDLPKVVTLHIVTDDNVCIKITTFPVRKADAGGRKLSGDVQMMRLRSSHPPEAVKKDGLDFFCPNVMPPVAAIISRPFRR
jgi:hypothetical protein